METLPSRIRDRLNLPWAALLIATFAIPSLLLLPFLSEPIYGDDAIYATIARGMLDGRALYAELIDLKPPLIFGWYAALFLLVGDSVEVMRWSIGLMLGVTAVLVALVGERLYSRRVGVIAGVVFALSTGLTLLNANGSGEQLMLAPLVGSLLAYVVAVRGGGAMKWFVLAGVLAGLAGLTKTVGLFNLGALLVASWFVLRETGPRWWFGPAVMLGSAAAVYGLALLPFLLSGTLGAAFEANVEIVLAYGSVLSLAERTERAVQGVTYFVLIGAGPLAVALIAATIAFVRSFKSSTDALLALWALASLAGVASASWFFPHYWIQLLPAAALIIAVAADRTIDRLRAERPSLVAFGLGVVVVQVGVLLLQPTIGVYTAPTVEARHELRRETSGPRETASQTIGEFVREITSPGDRIYVQGYTPAVYYYADRAPASRFFLPPFYRIVPDAYEGALATIVAEPPAVVVEDVTEFPADHIWTFDRQPAAYVELLEREYVLVAEIEFAWIYLHRSIPAGVAAR